MIAIIEIAGDDQRIDLLREAKIDYIYEGASGSIPDQFSESRISQCKGLQWRV